MNNMMSKMLSCVFASTLLPVQFAYARIETELPKNHTVSLTFHDVRDDVLKEGDRDIYAIQTNNLAQFLDWLSQSDWKPIRLKDIEEARKQGKELPHNSILLTFDDGALSSYSRVFPLLKQYKIPAVFALPTSWLNGNIKAGYEAYGQGNLVNWAQVREMQASGLAEFASHSDDLHHGVLANPQGNEQPAATSYAYLKSQSRYETDAEYQQRILQDLKKSYAVLKKEVGVNPKAIIWPYGAVNEQLEKLAQQAGFQFSFSLGRDGMNRVSDSTFKRSLVIDNPTAEQLTEGMLNILNFEEADLFKQPRHFVSMDLKHLAAQQNSQTDEKLGQLLSKLYSLKNNALIFKPLEDKDGDGQYDVAYFPTNKMSVQQDILNRSLWQAQTRAGQSVILELPAYPQKNKPFLTVDLAKDIARFNSNLSGIQLNAGSSLNCAMQKITVQESCIEQSKQLEQLSQLTKKAVKPYLNMSNQAQFSLLLTPDLDHVENLPELIKTLLMQHDLVNLKFDVIGKKKQFNQLLTLLNTLDENDKQRIMLTLVLPENSQKNAWEEVQQGLFSIQRVGIQKFGIDGYDFEKSKDVHQYLYNPLSLNASPVMYQPFAGLVEGKK
ncbi:poly-beta-1,6-N-acetyl-D-glucosamine N-deacetylase PgaB [Acinetobacter pittii]|uniref:poly-beta-1,6-N-acetyl-D-glucosamine N-deacetylase PgaB n=1 Tax=Acinetobacter pittii TaxID=48296 RepID=UPI0002CFACD0|nr:poly-beta-1,6-N-acetyl-D-glucosamine N-deacetylase PgaB [Acinetobacter pittii]ENW10869.1 poly-beta-1,6-N-acetyl-D-glucosamine N-deacetylase PgaB [Acinetobacter pittii ATCC 19004 = CIP 70.29]MCG9503722.1 poly-beta-1,6-N-acetyl-D-glucosamine N-deacetylase PgaB [Acinetobacter pittii]MCK0869287.1 poly-beta-1,6-N-acetyl-D-glucosamine N-deacetylase PgaB [Acinetobacter pittii]MCK0919554.1 poly-beta-1,6-N-acetyl-D-glucosamine N-deacetylase PgaB [Acinetobacter pittii]QXA12484.1 poly-beta-1,6-N-acety